jgi:riboflavin kinase/FMN adenylyltransferase
VQLIGKASALERGGRKVSVGIGMFDGVHLGHQQVLKKAINDARQHNGISLAITFDRHPNSVVAPARAPRLIYSLDQKVREIEGLGIDAILLIEFSREFSQQTGEQFVRSLARDLAQMQSVCVGSTFTFGHKRSGNVELLRKLGHELSYQVHGLAAVSLGGHVVSSTRIRERIAAGDLEAASQMLGRPYAISGKVVRGDQLGRKLGFPTANIDIGGLGTPPNGVYAVRVKTPAGICSGAANIGFRPSIPEIAPEMRLEVHLLGFEGDLYGAEVEVAFVDFIRPERKFATLDELKARIAQDVEAARFLLAA